MYVYFVCILGILKDMLDYWTIGHLCFAFTTLSGYYVSLDFSDIFLNGQFQDMFDPLLQNKRKKLLNIKSI